MNNGDNWACYMAHGVIRIPNARDGAVSSDKNSLKPGNVLHSMAITVIVTSTVSSDACLGIFEMLCTRNTGQIPKPS